MNDVKQEARQPWLGMLARFQAATSEQLKQRVQSFAKQLYKGTEHTFSGTATETAVIFNKRGLRCDWHVGDDPNPVVSLIQLHGDTPRFLDHQQRLIVDCPKLGTHRTHKRTAQVVSTGRIVTHKFGQCDVLEFLLPTARATDETYRIKIWRLRRSDFCETQFAPWWRMVLPHLDAQAASIGLPAKIEFYFGEAHEPSGSVELVVLEPLRVAMTAFSPPDGYRYRGDKPTEEWVKSGERADADAGRVPRLLASSAVPFPAFNTEDSELVRLVFDKVFVSRFEQLVTKVSTTLTSVGGISFRFDTAQILDDLHANSNNNVLGYLARRAGFGLLFAETDAISQQEVRDGTQAANRLANTLPDPTFAHPWREFFDGLSSNAQNKLIEMLTPPANDIARGLRVIDLFTDFSMGTIFFELGDRWLRFKFGELDVRPEAGLTQSDGDNTGWIYEDGHPVFVKDGIAGLIDVELSAWEHAITFDGQPLLDPLVLIEPSPVTQIVLPDLAIGLATTLRLKQLDLDFEVSTTPTHSPAAAALLFFCPPCWLALYQLGFISATVENLSLPVVIYLSQPSDRSAPPHLTVKISPIEHDDVDFTSIAFGIFPLLQILISVVGSIIGDFVVPMLMENLHEKLQAQLDKLLRDLPDIRLQDLCRLDYEYMRELFTANLKSRERDAANANLELSNKTGAFRAAAAKAGVNPDASHNTLWHSAVATEYAAMLAAEADAEAAGRQLATAQADIEQMKNSPMPGTTVAGGYTTNPAGYHLLLSGVSAPTLGVGALDFPPGDTALDADLALLMSNTYVKQSLGELRPSANYRGQLRHLVENGGVWTAGAELDLWTDAPDQASMAAKPERIKSGWPNVIMYCANLQSIPDWWGYAAVLKVGVKEVRVLPVNDAAPDQPIAELVIRAELMAGASHFVAVAYEVCEDVSHIRPRLEELGGWRPPSPSPLPLIGMEVAGRFHRVNEARGPSFAGAWPADMADREVRFVYGQAVDAASGRRVGGRAPRGGGFVPADSSRGRRNPVPSDDLFPIDYRPGPDQDFPPQEPGALLCECRVGWETEESEDWLTAVVEARVSVFTGIKTVLKYTDLSTLKFLPHISYRFSLDSLTPIGNLAIQASGPLAGLGSTENANWLQTRLHQHIRWRLARSRYATSGPGGGADLKYLYGANIPATLEPEGFTPAVALAWNTDLVIEPFPGIDVRPPLITLRTFGNDPDRLNVAVRMHLFENILQQL